MAWALAWPLVAGHAVAAEFPAIFKPTPAPPPLAWTGFFGGVHAGFGFSQKQFLDNFPVPDLEVDATARVRGGIFGVQGGYNQQINNWLLLGVEGDFTWSDIHGEFSCFPFGDQRCSARPEWLASLAGRIGITTGPALFYVKGGGAWVQDQFTDVATCAGAQPRSRAGITAACGDSFFGSQLRLGWVVGGGVEYMFASNWSAKLEYNYMDFGGKSVPFTDLGTGFFTEEIHQNVHLLKVGLNYHFGFAGPAPVVPVTTLGYAAPALSKDEEVSSHVLAFAGFDAAKFSYGGYAGALIAPYQDLDTSGLRVMVQGEGGVYRYSAGGDRFRGYYTSGSALAGYGFEGDNYSINVLAGINAINHTVSPIDPDNRAQGTSFGAKLRADAWVNPTPKTLVYSEGEVSSAFRTFYTKAKLGYDVTESRQIFLGPEVGVLGNERFTQWRVGAHVTQLKIGRLQLDISAGYANDNTVGSGAYATVEVSQNF